MRHLFAIGVLLLLLQACTPTSFTPKPMGYYKLDTPAKHEYRVFDNPDYPYTFEYPVYAELQKDSAFFKAKADNPYWLDISFPTIGSTINLTYKAVANKDAFMHMMGDSYELSFVHHKNADFINEDLYQNQHGVFGILYTAGGNSASRYQFVATDSVNHFIRGAMYFNTTPNADSLKPLNDFMIRDIAHMLQTIKFRKK